MEEARKVAFRTLRPPCVELSQIALKHKASKATGQEVIKALETLSFKLQEVAEGSSVLDSKLADYVFFPLSHIFRDFKELPARAVEVALQCLHILILRGWKNQIAPEMSKQLLILLSLIAGGSPKEAKVKNVHEEMAAAAFECVDGLFSASDAAGLSDQDGSIATENVPMLGHTVTVLLDGLLEGTTKTRMPALNALRSMIHGVKDREALRSVFPGTVSTITKLLSSRGIERPSFEVLVNGIEALKASLVKTIADEQKNHHSVGVNTATLEAPDSGIEDKWIKATASQVKMALANVIPLRYHEKEKVRATLLQLCIAVIQNCRESLDQTTPMAIETVVIICSQSSLNLDATASNIAALFVADAALSEVLKKSLYDWIVAMPRVMQSNDDTRKERLIDQISTAFRILELQGESLSILYDFMATNLQASVLTAIQANYSQRIAPASEGPLEVSRILHSTRGSSQPLSFDQVLFHGSLSITNMAGLEHLARQLQGSPMYSKFQQDIGAITQTTAEDEQLASLWLSLQLLSSSSQDDDITSQYLNLPAVSDAQAPLLDEIYRHALNVLSMPTFEDSDRWKLQCLCLEAIALQARHQEIEFRGELIDALYPVLERLGSANSILQSHALTCFSIVSSSCQYASPATLIIDNADYLVNAISRKLNAHEISPQVPQVLVMVIALCGPTLIPYLDDIVDSIFSILDWYHGYPNLVQSLFTILNAIVSEAAKVNTKAIDYRPDGITKPHYPNPTSNEDLTNLLRTNRNKKEESEPCDPSPLQPTSPTQRPPTPTPPSPSITTTLILKITSQTHSHLTSPSPTLRAALCTLLSQALPFLASDANTLLPISATLFPLLSTRIFATNSSPSTSSKNDPPPYELIAALAAFTTLLHCSGDFLASRVADPRWWAELKQLYARAEAGMWEERRMMGRKRGERWRVWDGVVGVLVGIVKDVGVSGEMEKGFFEMVGAWAVGEKKAGERDRGGVMDEGRSGEVREVLGLLNEDLLWMMEERARVGAGGGRMEKPEAVEGREFRELE